MITWLEIFLKNEVMKYCVIVKDYYSWKGL